MGSPVYPTEPRRSNAKPFIVKEAKMVWESLLSVINSLLPGSVAISLLITCVLSFKGQGLSTTKLL